MVDRRGRRSANLRLVLAIYLAFYLAASWCDLASTELGLQRPGTSEKNVFAVGPEGEFDAAKAWLLTIGGAAILGACVAFAVARAEAMDPRWLRQPVRALAQFHLNPFSQKGLAVAPLQLLSLAVAYPLLRMIAAANNVLVYWTGFGPMGALMKVVAAETSPLIGFALVAISAFVLVLIVIAPLAARLLQSWRAAT